jgi:5-methylcytosine-specific restriction endonuclease McrA
MQRKAVRNLWYQKNAKRVYNKYKSYHIKYNAGRLRAERLIKKLGIPKVCMLCKNTYKVEIHHVNKDVNNNNLSNLQILCKNCHAKHHAKEKASNLS